MQQYYDPLSWVTTVLPFLEFYRNYILQYAIFGVCLALSVIWIFTNLLIHSAIGGHLDGVKLSTNNAIMKMCYKSLDSHFLSFLLDKYKEWNCWGLWQIHLTLEEADGTFSKGVVLTCIPTSLEQGVPVAPYPLQQLLLLVPYNWAF